MKKITLKTLSLILIVVAGLQTQNSLAQAPTWQWAHNAGDHGDEGAFGTAIDGSGNVYITGWYTSSFINFGTVTLLNTNPGTADMFVTKYDANGNVLWSKNFGGIDGDIGNAIAVDASGNAYVTGWYSSPLLAFGTSTLSNPGSPSSDIFVAKLNASGTVQWAKTYGGTAAERGYGIALDPSGNVFTTGGFGSTSVSFGSTTLTNAGTVSDIFISKHDSNGNELWAKAAGGTSSDAGYSVATDSLGNAYVTGMFTSASVNFGTGAHTNSGVQDVFITKYNGLGIAVWSKAVGGSLDESGNAIAVKKGSVYVTGGFSSPTVTFGSTQLHNNLTGTLDVFIAKYDLAGNFAWANSAGGSDSEAGSGIACDANSNVYVTGYFKSNAINFGGNTVNSAAPTTSEIFVVAYSAAGGSGWAVGATNGSYDDAGNSIAIDPTGTDVYVGGIFNSGLLTFGTSNIYKGCGNDVFIAKLSGPAFVGIKEEFLKEQISVYPNPSNGRFYVEADGEVIISNVLGQVILEDKISGKKQFDLSAQPKGAYTFTIKEKKGTRSGRVVVE